MSFLVCKQDMSIDSCVREDLFEWQHEYFQTSTICRKYQENTQNGMVSRISTKRLVKRTQSLLFCTPEAILYKNSEISNQYGSDNFMTAADFDEEFSSKQTIQEDRANLRVAVPNCRIMEALINILFIILLILNWLRDCNHYEVEEYKFSEILKYFDIIALRCVLQDIYLSYSPRNELIQLFYEGYLEEDFIEMKTLLEEKYGDDSDTMEVDEPNFAQDKADEYKILGSISAMANENNEGVLDQYSQKPTLNYSEDDKIGEGNSSCVYKGTIQLNGVMKKLAWKQLKLNDEEKASFLREMRILSHPDINHNNIVQMMAHIKYSGRLVIGLELCEGGSLKTRLDNIRKAIMYGCVDYVTNGIFHSMIRSTQIKFVRWCAQIASGMEHLEYIGIVHGDLAARNILLDSDDTAKISDFGLSHTLDSRKSTSQKRQALYKIAFQWAAIETLTCGVFTSKTDVWSFGMTLFEIFSVGETPFQMESKVEDLITCLQQGQLPDNPFPGPSPIYEQMKACWNCNPELRPGFKNLCSFFHTILELLG